MVRPYLVSVPGSKFLCVFLQPLAWSEIGVHAVLEPLPFFPFLLIQRYTTLLRILEKIYIALVGSPPTMFIMVAEVAPVCADKHIPDCHN